MHAVTARHPAPGQVVPALDPNTPIYAGGFSMQLIKRRMMEFNLWNPDRFKTFRMRERFQLGPFECAPRRPAAGLFCT